MQLDENIILDNTAENSAESDTLGNTPAPVSFPQQIVMAESDIADQPAEDICPEKDADKAVSDVQNSSPNKKLFHDALILLGIAMLFSLCSIFLLTSGEKRTDGTSEKKNFTADISAEILAIRNTSLDTISDLPKVYILPWSETPPPVSSPEGYGKEIAEDGTEILTYNDETLSVKYWCERIHDSNCHFAEVKVAHPTQLRTALAGGEFGGKIRYTPQKIARQVNAVVAINGDYCGYRNRGIIIRQDVLYRDSLRGWDILLIDSDGNFHIMQDSQVESSGVLEEYDIVNTMHFGPSLVVDGEIKLLNILSGCGKYWNEGHVSPRTGIGQIGKLHYLFCCVEGRNDQSKGVFTSQFAQIMYDKGCVQAYNLDGGMSTTMIFNGEAMNYPMWGSQRVVTDILYCATAIPSEE